MNTDLKALISDRLSVVDHDRARLQRRPIYVYVADTTAGAVAAPPSAKTVKVMRPGDPIPRGAFWARYFDQLQDAYEERTRRTGPNVRRWKGDGDGE